MLIFCSAGSGPTREGSYADLMAKRGRRMTPAQLSSTLRTAPPVPRPSLPLTPGTGSSNPLRAEPSASTPAANSAVDSGGFSFAVTPCENSRSPTLFKGPGPGKSSDYTPTAHPQPEPLSPGLNQTPVGYSRSHFQNPGLSHTPVDKARAQPHIPAPSHTPSSQPGRSTGRVGASEVRASRIAHLQKFVDRVLLRSEEQELGEAGNVGGGGEEREGDGEQEEAVTLTTIHQVWPAHAFVVLGWKESQNVALDFVCRVSVRT